MLGVGRGVASGFVDEYKRVVASANVKELLRLLVGDTGRYRGFYKKSLKKMKSMPRGDREVLEYALLFIRERLRRGTIPYRVKALVLSRFASVMLCRDISVDYVADLFEEALLGIRHGDSVIILPYTFSMAEKLGSRRKIPDHKSVYKILSRIDGRLMPVIYSLYYRGLGKPVVSRFLYEKTYGTTIDDVMDKLCIKEILFVNQNRRPVINVLIKQIVVEAINRIALEKAREIMKQLHGVFKKQGIEIDLDSGIMEKETLCTRYKARDSDLEVYVCPYATRIPFPRSTTNIIVLEGEKPLIQEYLTYNPVISITNTLLIYTMKSREAIALTSNTENKMFRNIVHELNKKFGNKVVLVQISYTRSKLLNPVAFRENLMRDLEWAEQRLIIVSPFLKENIVRKALERGFLAKALNKKIDTKIVTLSPSSKGIQDRGQHRVLEQKKCIDILTEKNIDVILKKNMHFKTVIIDNEIVYIGSINPLSTVPRTSNDYMIRIVDKNLVEEIEEAIGLREQAT